MKKKEISENKDRRKADRRKGFDRRVGEADQIFEWLIFQGSTISERRNERRKRNRRSSSLHPTKDSSDASGV